MKKDKMTVLIRNVDREAVAKLKYSTTMIGSNLNEVYVKLLKKVAQMSAEELGEFISS